LTESEYSDDALVVHISWYLGEQRKQPLFYKTIFILSPKLSFIYLPSWISKWSAPHPIPWHSSNISPYGFHQSSEC